jgi:hypothetical protein
MPRLMTPTLLLAVSLTAGFFVSCNRSEDPGMIEKVALLEAELRDRDQQIATLQEASPASAAPAVAAAADVDTAKANYLKCVDSLRAKLIAGLPDTKFDRTSVFPVEGPDPLKPIGSKVAFKVIHKDGRSGEIVVPLAADMAGAWLEPASDEIITGFKAKSAATPPAVATTTPKAATMPPNTPGRTQPNDVMGANRTQEIAWDDAPGTKPPTAAPPTPEVSNPPPTTPPIAPTAPSGPKKVMPTARDINIDFGD